MMYGELTFVSPVRVVAVCEQKTLKKKLAKGVWDMTKQKVDVQVQRQNTHRDTRT
jgi:hypothetical protein